MSEADPTTNEEEITTIPQLSKLAIEAAGGLSGRKCAEPKNCPTQSPAGGVDCYNAVMFGFNQRCPYGTNDLTLCNVALMETVSI